MKQDQTEDVRDTFILITNKFTFFKLKKNDRHHSVSY